jgi:phosphatidylglycerol:prolipoprotein diacylglycerol transferase
MLHDLSPFLFKLPWFSPDFGVRWYGVAYMTGFVCAYFLYQWLARRQRAGLTPEMVGDFVTYGALGILIGGRLGYAVFYSPDLFLKFKTEIPFWGVLAVNEGGMASHGGMIGLVIACWIFARKHGISQNHLYDLAAIAGPIGIFFGRIANFINGELVGRPCDPNFPLAVKFPQDLYLWPSSESSRLPELAAVVEKLPGGSREMYLEMAEKFRTNPSAQNFINNTISQIIEAVQSGNEAVKEALAPLLTARHPSQLYAAAGEGLFLFLALFILWYKPRKPGVIGSIFICLYAVVRIIDEQFRTPDAHLGFQLFGLTRGQWLSIGMLIVGLALLIMYSRRGGLPISGWGRGQSVRLNRRSK